MKLTYRGVDYETNPLDGNAPQELLRDRITGEVGGKYRGTIWRFHYVSHENPPQFAANLRYRGVGYHLGDRVKPEIASIPQEQNRDGQKPVYEHRELLGTWQTTKQTTKSSSQNLAGNLATTHLENIRQNLERRLAVARANGDEVLVNLLQKEANYLV